MSKSLWCAGNANLKGKKSVMCYCKCCDVVDLRDKLNKKDLIKELKEFKIKIR